MVDARPLRVDAASSALRRASSEAGSVGDGIATRSGLGNCGNSTGFGAPPPNRLAIPPISILHNGLGALLLARHASLRHSNGNCLVTRLAMLHFYLDILAYRVVCFADYKWHQRLPLGPMMARVCI